VNQADRKEFDIIHNKIDNITKSVDELKHDMSMAHGKTDESLRFLKKIYSTHTKGYGQKQNKIVNSENQQLNGEVLLE